MRDPAPCGGEECANTIRLLRIRLAAAIEMVAEFHDRTRVLWGEEQRYVDSELYKKAKRAMAEH